MAQGLQHCADRFGTGLRPVAEGTRPGPERAAGEIHPLAQHRSGVTRVDDLLDLEELCGAVRRADAVEPLAAEDPTPEELTKINNQVLEALQHWHHRAFGFAYLNPNHLEFSLEEFDRCVRDGPMVGVKLWIARKCNTPELDPIVEHAASTNAVIFQHTWVK